MTNTGFAKAPPRPRRLLSARQAGSDSSYRLHASNFPEGAWEGMAWVAAATHAIRGFSHYGATNRRFAVTLVTVRRGESSACSHRFRELFADWEGSAERSWRDFRGWYCGVRGVRSVTAFWVRGRLLAWSACIPPLARIFLADMSLRYAISRQMSPTFLPASACRQRAYDFLSVVSFAWHRFSFLCACPENHASSKTSTFPVSHFSGFGSLRPARVRHWLACNVDQFCRT